jgi:hypothetical protein
LFGFVGLYCIIRGFRLLTQNTKFDELLHFGFRAFPVECGYNLLLRLVYDQNDLGCCGNVQRCCMIGFWERRLVSCLTGFWERQLFCHDAQSVVDYLIRCVVFLVWLSVVFLEFLMMSASSAYAYFFAFFIFPTSKNGWTNNCSTPFDEM